MAATATYIQTVGRRKTAVAVVRITPAKNTTFTVNEKPMEEYFGSEFLSKTASSPFTEAPGISFAVSVHVTGGGVHAQAEAIRHGLARALVKQDEALRGAMKHRGFLTRDARMKERKKFGLRGARRAPQWSKR